MKMETEWARWAVCGGDGEKKLGEWGNTGQGSGNGQERLGA